MRRTAILLSGGMDSIAIAYSHPPAVAITVDYGQLPAEGEIRAASAVCEELRIDHHIVRVDLRELGSGDLAGRASIAEAPAPEWWPFRNQLLITLAAMRVIGNGVASILLGTVKGDDVHVDGRSEFIAAMAAVLSLQEGGLNVEAPAIDLTSAELIVKSAVPPELLAWAHSCHVAPYACGRCRGCRKHYDTLEAIGLDAY